MTLELITVTMRYKLGVSDADQLLIHILFILIPQITGLIQTTDD